MADPGLMGGSTKSPEELGRHMAKMRSILRAHGYNVNADGPLNPRLRSAWEHYQAQIRVGPVVGHRTAAWNRQNYRRPGGGLSGDRGARTSEMADRGTTHSARSNLTDATHRAVPKPDKYDRAKNKMAPKDPAGDASRTTKTHVRAAAHAKGLGAGAKHKVGGAAVPGVRDNGANVNKLLSPDMADSIAGEQYDPTIQTIKQEQAQGGRDAKQHQADIGGWYGQVESSQDTARGRDAAAGATARDSVSNELSGILASLGGSRGAGVVGAQGLADLTDIASQGASQDRFNSDLAPILKSEEAGAHSREEALASQAAAALGMQLKNAQGARGQAKVKALMDIVQANNQSRQQNFGNKLAISNADLAAQSLGLDKVKTLASINEANTRTSLAKKQLALQTLDQQKKSGKPDFAMLNYPDRMTVINDAVGRAVSELGTPKVGQWDPNHVLNSALGYLRAGGYSSARKAGFTGGGVNPRSQSAILLGLTRALHAAHQAYHANAVKQQSQ